MMNEIHKANQKTWDTNAERWEERTLTRGFWNRCHEDPSLVLVTTELELLHDIAGKSVCVLGSGDNEVAFALTGLGAKVTSVDISERQLETAAQRAETLGLTLEFVRADISDLSVFEDNTYDVVYTGGHISVWLSNIHTYYSEAVRVLKRGGLYLVNDYHPFRRIWRWGSKTFELETPYFNRGPHECVSRDGLPQFEHHWTVADHVQALLDAGCELTKIEEYGDQNDDWNETHLEGLPQYLLLAGRKR